MTPGALCLTVLAQKKKNCIESGFWCLCAPILSGCRSLILGRLDFIHDWYFVEGFSSEEQRGDTLLSILPILLGLWEMRDRAPAARARLGFLLGFHSSNCGSSWLRVEVSLRVSDCIRCVSWFLLSVLLLVLVINQTGLSCLASYTAIKFGLLLIRWF